MELFAKLFGPLLPFVYHGFDRIVINGYLSGLSRPEQVVYFFREVVGVAAVEKSALSQRTKYSIDRFTMLPGRPSVGTICTTRGAQPAKN